MGRRVSFCLAQKNREARSLFSTKLVIGIIVRPDGSRRPSHERTFCERSWVFLNRHCNDVTESGRRQDLSLRIVSLIVDSFVAETIIENAGAANQAGRIFYDFFDSLRDSIWSA